MIFRTVTTLMLLCLWAACFVPGNLAGPVVAPFVGQLVTWKLESDGQYWLTDRYERWVKVKKEQWEATPAKHVLHKNRNQR